jgi:hypothetical protein
MAKWPSMGSGAESTHAYDFSQDRISNTEKNSHIKL